MFVSSPCRAIDCCVLFIGFLIAVCILSFFSQCCALFRSKSDLIKVHARKKIRIYRFSARGKIVYHLSFNMENHAFKYHPNNRAKRGNKRPDLVKLFFSIRMGSYFSKHIFSVFFFILFSIRGAIHIVEPENSTKMLMDSWSFNEWTSWIFIDLIKRPENSFETKYPTVTIFHHIVNEGKKVGNYFNEYWNYILTKYNCVDSQEPTCQNML